MKNDSFPPVVGSGTRIAYDSANRKIYTFGGYSGNVIQNSLYSYSCDSRQWSLITPGNAGPLERAYHIFVKKNTFRVLFYKEKIYDIFKKKLSFMPARFQV